MRSAALGSIVLFGCIFLTACTPGPKLVKITGTLKSNDQKLKVDPKGSVTVVFTPVADAKANINTYTAIYRTDEPTFEVNNIPEGKYKISLMCMVLNPTSETEDINQRFSAEKTPIVREIKTGTENVVIDLAKPNP